jgi:hypothetical protein
MAVFFTHATISSIGIRVHERMAASCCADRSIDHERSAEKILPRYSADIPRKYS